MKNIERRTSYNAIDDIRSTLRIKMKNNLMIDVHEQAWDEFIYNLWDAVDDCIGSVHYNVNRWLNT